MLIISADIFIYIAYNSVNTTVVGRNPMGDSATIERTDQNEYDIRNKHNRDFKPTRQADHFVF